jgi:putative transcriptional regulator
MAERVINKVYEMRTRYGVTQEELAVAINVSRQTIIAMEKGNYSPSVTLAIKIARFFKRSVEDVFALTT